jgi:hypothetical protein
VVLLIVGVGTTWYLTWPQTVEQLAQDRELAELRRDPDFHGLPVDEQHKVVEWVRTGRWRPTHTHLQWAREQHAELPGWRWGGTVAVLLVVGMLWGAGVIALAVTHSVARLIDRYPA